MNEVQTPPPGFGPAVAVSRAPADERRKAIIGTLAGYAVIALGVAALHGFYWPALLLVAAGAGATILTVQRSALAAGDGWLKMGNGWWVETARLVAVRLRVATTATFVQLEDAGGRKLNVRLDELARTPQVWDAFYAGLARSLDNGLVVREPTGARIRATNLAVRLRRERR